MAYKVKKGAKGCSRCESAFVPEREFHSALFDEGKDWRREDFCGSCWSGRPDASFCHWKTRFQPEEKRPVFDQDRVLTVFDHVSEAESPSRNRLRYLVALMLVRKRVFRLLGTSKVAEREEIRVHCPDRETEYRVHDPGFSADEIEAAQTELADLLDLPA